MAQVDIVVMGNQSGTTYLDLDNPARTVTCAPASSPSEPPKKRRGRPPGSKNRTRPDEAAAQKENEDG